MFLSYIFALIIQPYGSFHKYNSAFVWQWTVDFSASFLCLSQPGDDIHLKLQLSVVLRAILTIS